MNQKDRVQALAVLRRQGMMKQNTQIIAEGGKFEDFLVKEIDWPESDMFRMQWSVQDQSQLQACKGITGNCYSSSANCHRCQCH